MEKRAIVARAKEGFLNLCVLCEALKEERDIEIGVTTVSHILKKYKLRHQSTSRKMIEENFGRL